jgi:hypothetical protein
MICPPTSSRLDFRKGSIAPLRSRSHHVRLSSKTYRESRLGGRVALGPGPAVASSSTPSTSSRRRGVPGVSHAIRDKSVANQMAIAKTQWERSGRGWSGNFSTGRSDKTDGTIGWVFSFKYEFFTVPLAA